MTRTGTLDRFSFSAESPAASWISLNEDKSDEEFQLGQADLSIEGTRAAWYDVVCWLARRSVAGQPAARVRLTGDLGTFPMLDTVEFFNE